MIEHSVPHETPVGELRTVNTAKPTGDDRYDWEIHVEAPDEVLDRIDRVDYVLHETFPEPVRRREDRDSGFSLTSNGWGEFVIGVLLHLRDGDIAKLWHPLRLVDEG